MRRAALALALVLAACGGEPPPDDRRAADVRRLAQHYRDIHPDLHHEVSKERFGQAVADLIAGANDLSEDGFLVELMRLAALPGERDGHTGIFPLDPGHERQLHLYPLRLYDFPDGTHVVAQVSARDLVGARVVAVAGVPWSRAQSQVRPLVPGDNDGSREARSTQFAVTAEVLHGLGLIPAVEPVEWTFERDGERFTRTIEPIPAGEYAEAFEDFFDPLVPPALPTAEKRPLFTRRIAGGRAQYVGYNVTTVATGTMAARLRREARDPRLRAIVVDLRRNPGGDNGTYQPLLAALRRLSRTERIVVLISRATFSAAANFATELEPFADFVGEPSGGSPNLFGDSSQELLPASGLNVHVATMYWEMSEPDDDRPAIEPRVRAAPSASDHFGERDPVLDAALRLGLGGGRIPRPGT